MRRLFTDIFVLLCFLLCSTEPGAGFYIEPDKKLHLGAGIITGTVSYFICPEVEELIFDESVVCPVVWSIGMAGLAGAGKEIVYDEMMGKGYSDINDFYYTLAGGVISGFTLALCEYFFKSSGGTFSLEADPVEREFVISYHHFY